VKGDKCCGIKKENRAGEKEVGVLKVEIDGFDFK
jgi:hypothetical protein